MAQATLIVAGKGESREVPLEAKAVVLGRSSACDVVLDSALVSRQHARIFPDPFGRWIIEDLGSRLGVLVGGRRVGAHAIVPGERIIVGPFILSVAQPLDERIAAAPTASTTTRLVEGGADLEVVRTGATADAALSRDRLRELNRLGERLDALAGAADLYPEVCRCLAAAASTAALVIRLPASGGSAAAAPQVLAYHVAPDRPGLAPGGPGDLYLSKRVVEAIRSSGQPVMATSVRSKDAPLTLTIVDERRPRAVLCVPIGEPAGATDALYVDMPLQQAAADTFDFLQAVARQVRLARRGLLLVEAKAQRRVIDHELSLARQIQARLTPEAVPDVPGVDLAFHYEPAMWVGGDYCDLWLLPDGRLAFAVGDVAGKGLPAAIVMACLQAALRTATLFCSGPAQPMDHVNRHIGRHTPEEMFVTLFLGFLDPRSGRLEYVNAGHLLPLVVRPDGGVAPLGRPANPVLGLFDGPYVAEAETLAPGTALLVVTDGVTDAVDASGERFGLERIEDLLRSARPESARQLVRMTTEAAAKFRGLVPQQDDVTALGLVWRGPAAT